MAPPGVEMPGSDWSQLLPEILDIIASKIMEIEDYVRFRAVCKTWRSSTSTPTNNGQPRWQPWLLLPYDAWSSMRRFFSPSTQKVYTLDLPESRGRAIRGTSHGWLLMVDISLSFSLLNPITRTLVHLPFIENLPNQDPEYHFRRGGGNIVIRVGDNREHQVGLDDFLDYFQCFTFMSEDNKFFVAVTHARFLIYWKVGDEAWTTLHVPAAAESLDIETITYHSRRFYAIHCNGYVTVWDLDLDPETPGINVPSLTVDPSYAFGQLVSFSEKLLLITCRYINYYSVTMSMHKLDEGAREGQMWSKIEGLDYGSLFYTFSDENMIITATGDLERNSIYLADPYYDGRWAEACPVHGIDLIRVGDGSVSEVQDTWFQSFYRYFRATWCVPSLS